MRYLCLCAFVCGMVLASALHAQADETPRLDPFKDNLLVDGELKLTQPTEKDPAPKVDLKTPRYWTLKSDGKELSGLDLPFDKDVKFVGDCSIRLDGTGGKQVFSKSGWNDTKNTMRHGWSYTAGVRLKLKDVKGKVWVEVGYSWGKAKSKELSGTMDWTQVQLPFVLDADTNLLQQISVYFEGAGTVWIDDLQLRMNEPEAYKWWFGWNGFQTTAKLGNAIGTDEAAGVLKPLASELELDQYGGVKALKSNATGAFRCEKTNGKWWLITPDGHGFFKTAMFEPSFTTYRNSNTVVDAMGGRTAWSVQTWLRLKGLGFNAIEWGPSFAMDTIRAGGKGVPPELAGQSLAYPSNARFELATDPNRNGGIKVPGVDWGWGNFPDVFSTEFAQAVENYAKPGQKGSHFRPRPDDKWLIGYVLADEPKWYGPGIWYGSLADGFHGLADSSPGKQKWLEMLKGEYGEIAKLNAAWEAKFASWEEFAATKPLPRNKQSVEDRRQFMGVIADRWYELAAGQVRKYDTKHMVLGGNATRLFPAVFAAEAKHVDVLCASLYQFSGVYRPSPEFQHYIVDGVYSWTNKPILTGFMTGENDAGGMPGTRCVETAAQRGQTYLSFMRQMAAHEAVVGTFWWMYVSWPEPNNEGYAKNWGMVSADNQPYLDLLPYIQRANANVHLYRLGQTPKLIEAPTLFQPIHGQLVLGDRTRFVITPLPYKVDRYEVEIRPADGKGEASTLTAQVSEGRIIAEVALPPGTYHCRSRSLAGQSVSAWSLPVEFVIADAGQIAAFREANQLAARGASWKSTILQNEIKDGDRPVAVKIDTADASADSKAAPITLEVPAGQSVKRVTLECALPKPVLLRKNTCYSLRVRMQAETEAVAFPKVAVVLTHGYEVGVSQIDKGWTSQSELSGGGKPTLVRTTFRLPRDQAAETLRISLRDFRGGKVQVQSIELTPEEHYESSTNLLDDYEAIVKEFKSTVAGK